MYKASWAGAQINMSQISYEAPILFCILQAYFANKNFDELEQAAKKEVAGLTAEDWQKFVAYFAGFIEN